jgi:hypothetical protein
MGMEQSKHQVVSSMTEFQVLFDTGVGGFFVNQSQERPLWGRVTRNSNFEELGRLR